MALNFYKDFPFVPGNQLIQDDTATGDGVSNTITLRNKTATQVGSAIQADTTIYESYLNAFSFPTAQKVQLSTVPALNSQIVIPGKTGLTFPIFDQVNIPGQSSPANVVDEFFYLADDGTGPANIFVNTYNQVFGTPGIAIFFQNLASAAGAQTTFMQLACADVNGNVMTYQATGTTLYTAPYYALTQVAASSAALTNTLQVLNASGFYLGDYIIINPGGGTQENVKITGISLVTNTLTTTGQTFQHLTNELVVMNGRKFWARCTLPVGALGGVAQTFFNLGLCYDTILEAR